MTQPDDEDDLPQLGVLKGVDQDDIELLTPPPETLTLHAGETLVRQGDPCRGYFLLAQGRLRQFIAREDGGVRALGDLAPGEGVGELALLLDEPYEVTLRALRDSRVVWLPGTSFQQLMAIAPTVGLFANRALARRLKTQTALSQASQPVLRTPTLALIPAHAGIDTDAIAARLAESLRSLDPAQGARIVDTQALMRDANGSWHSEQTGQTDQVTLIPVPETASPAWVRRCVQHADQVLLFATAETDATACRLDPEAVGLADEALSPHADLVLLKGETPLPPDRLAHWLERLGRIGWHGLHPDQDADWQRLARILTGREVILVLAGGDAAALSQIGVLRALEEIHCPIDRLVGVGMGAVIAAHAALGYGPDLIEQIAEELWVQRSAWRRRQSVGITAKALARRRAMLRETCKGRAIEDLPCPIVLTWPGPDSHTRFEDSGDLAEALDRALMHGGGSAVPVLGEALFLSRGQPAPLPVAAVADRYPGLVLAVDCLTKRYRSQPGSGQEGAQDPAQHLGQAIGQEPDRALGRNTGQGPDQSQDLGPAEGPGGFGRLVLHENMRPFIDVLITPALPEDARTAFARLRALADAGRRATYAALTDAPERLRALLPGGEVPPLPDLEGDAGGRPEVTQRRARRRSLVASALIGVGLIALVLGAYHWLSAPRLPPGPPDAAALPPLPVEVVEVVPQTGFSSQDQFTGAVESRRRAELSFSRTGRLETMAVEDGDRVAAGALLAALDTRALNAKQRALVAEQASHAATLTSLQDKLAIARRNLARVETLRQKGNVSAQALDEAEADIATLEAERQPVLAAAESVAASIAELEVSKELSSLQAPFDGTVIARFAETGEAVGIGSPVVTLVEDAVKRVRAGLPPEVAAELSIGDSVPMTAGPQSGSATLIQLVPDLDETTRTIPAVFEIEDPNRRLADGVLARLTIARDVNSDGLWLPVSALLAGPRGLWTVYALSRAEEGAPERVERRVVTVVQIDGDRVFVQGALGAGDRVLVSGIDRVVPGQAVLGSSSLTPDY